MSCDMSSPDDSSPEVTISPADNGHVVRWHQRSTKKDEPGRTIKRVALTADEALGHAKSALGGSGGKSAKKRTSSPSGAASEGSLAEHSLHSARGRGSSRRRRPRIGGRR
jgi:hypothetical protein